MGGGDSKRARRRDGERGNRRNRLFVWVGTPEADVDVFVWGEGGDFGGALPVSAGTRARLILDVMLAQHQNGPQIKYKNRIILRKEHAMTENIIYSLSLV